MLVVFWPTGDGFSRRAQPILERFRAKWGPVRVKKTRQNNNLEPRFDSIETDKALGFRYGSGMPSLKAIWVSGSSAGANSLARPLPRNASSVFWILSLAESGPRSLSQVC
jgi:hypothetical protein